MNRKIEGGSAIPVYIVNEIDRIIESGAAIPVYIMGGAMDGIDVIINILDGDGITLHTLIFSDGILINYIRE